MRQDTLFAETPAVAVPGTYHGETSVHDEHERSHDCEEESVQAFLDPGDSVAQLLTEGCGCCLVALEHGGKGGKLALITDWGHGGNPGL